MANGEPYSKSHSDRLNLLLHPGAVPLFWLGSITLLVHLARLDWAGTVAGLLAIALSMGLQGFGHTRERVPPEPFTGAGDFVTRIIAEQFLKFPVFLFSGRWWRNLRHRAS